MTSLLSRVFYRSTNEHSMQMDKRSDQRNDKRMEGTYPSSVQMPNAHKKAIKNLFLARDLTSRSFAGGIHCASAFPCDPLYDGFERCCCEAVKCDCSSPGKEYVRVG
jgi:hypothetical protein